MDTYMRQLGLDGLVDVGDEGRVQAEEVGQHAPAVGGAQVRGLEEALFGEDKGLMLERSVLAQNRLAACHLSIPPPHPIYLEEQGAEGPRGLLLVVQEEERPPHGVHALHQRLPAPAAAAGRVGRWVRAKESTLAQSHVQTTHRASSSRERATR